MRSSTGEHCTLMIWFPRLFCLRESSSLDTPLVHTTVPLPHIPLENIPLYIHAGEDTDASRTYLKAFRLTLKDNARDGWTNKTSDLMF